MNRILHKLRALMREMHALRAKDGPYRFLVRRWDSISDVDLALRVLETEFFVQELIPQPLPIDSLQSILVLAPHQDDEAIGVGGSMLLAAAAGAKIDIVYVTDGTAKHSPYASSPIEAARIRQQEAKEVCSRIGASMHQLSISNQSPKPTAEDLDRLSEIIRDVKPQIVMAPWLLDSPAKHRLVNHLLWLANERNALPYFEVWGYQVHNTLFPNGYVDISSVAEQKRDLLQCYYSQNEFSKRYDHLAMGMSAWNSRFLKGAGPKYIEVFFALPVYELLRLVEKFYFPDLAATYRGHSAVLAGAQNLHRAVIDGSNAGQKMPMFGRKNKEITS